MPKNTRIGSDLGLAALMSLVADHGDSLHYSLSKRGRVWLTLTHYEGERYATSGEFVIHFILPCLVKFLHGRLRCFGYRRKFLDFTQFL